MINFADLRNGYDGLQARLAMYECASEDSWVFMWCP